MIIENDNLDLKQIETSGQCFRWNEENDYIKVVAFDREIRMKQLGMNQIDMDCDEKEYEDIWKKYLDIDTDYGKIIDMVSDEDLFLKNASNFGKGIRILNQDEWEVLISFIISQRKNIPAIKSCIEKICKMNGRKINGDTYAFPTADELGTFSVEDLSKCSLGYRAEYIYRAAAAFRDGAVTIEKLKSLSDDELFDALCALYGVGKKVANCTMLFGFHRLDSFPIDVWMNKIMDKYYKDGFETRKYTPYAGVMQQYMFAYERFLSSNN